MKVCVFALDGMFDTGITAILDTLCTANEIAKLGGADTEPFQVTVIGVKPRVKTALGLTMAVEPAREVDRPDWVVVPALNAKMADVLVPALARRDVEAAKSHLREWRAQGIGIAAACIGTFVLADSGLLDGEEATTTWSLSPLFRERYPTVRLDDSRMIVTSNGLVTAGAAMGHLDLALWFVRQVSPELASNVARFLLIDNRASQAQYVIPDYLAHADPLVERFERWSREHMSQGFSLESAASALHVHVRTLQRRTEQVLGKSPLAFFQDLRIQRARQLVSNGCDLETVAAQVGYADASTLRSLLRRKLGRTVKELRKD
ncbi:MULTISPECIES: helix-turn-helix domain-containing protein [Pandoraea]|uniref:GlxA family transcriptional regulator n=1 Tax=Pandoraea TaxID=93217 RepID=UPI001F5C2DB0|nr:MULTISPECIES: helix-turn-helix domain-containing protein [Pandoraea]MCI3204139.1 AraC family transcriptional regulator [Pandoraea sp. LA3]MDN4582165.1 AraC family transcriptional regulator [Pandoraea capi]